MSFYILDTDTLQLFQDGNAAVVSHVESQAATRLAITVITVDEQLSGWYAQLRKAKTPERLAWAYRRLAGTVRLLKRLEIVDFDEAAINQYATLKKLKLNVGKMDLRIAATVLEVGGTLVTRNARDFKQVPGLAFVDWSK
jgi:tRNA(fMet)-specific endonuclease VapC